jgi:hypothetical protein
MERFFHARAADKTVAVEMSGDVADFLRVTAVREHATPQAAE